MERSQDGTCNEMTPSALPGGDQDVFGALPDELKACLAGASRVVLVANNPAISAADIDALSLGAGDVVVSFNTCIKAGLLNPLCTHVFVHGFNAPDAYFFGLPYGPDAMKLIEHPQARCFTVLVGCTAAMSPLPQVTLLRERIPLPPLWNYPVDRPGGKRYVGPSTGFNALVLLDWLRRRAGYHYQLFTLGFSNEAGKLWGGHAWDYEREWLLGSDVTSIKLQPQSWWQRLFKRIK